MNYFDLSGPMTLLAHDTSGRDATYVGTQDQVVDLTMDAIVQLSHECETYCN